VYRNNTDNMLLFATRLQVFTEDPPEPDLELNHIQRFGFSGYTTAAGWYFPEGDVDGFRLRSVARTSEFFSNTAGTLLSDSAYDANVVTFNTDISIAEGAPNSAWFAIKTNATEFSLLDLGVLVHQDEDGAIRNFGYAGLAPVPEPSEYAMMGLGLVLVAGMMRRRRSRTV